MPIGRKVGAERVPETAIGGKRMDEHEGREHDPRLFPGPGAALGYRPTSTDTVRSPACRVAATTNATSRVAEGTPVVWVVIPTYDEADNVEAMLAAVTGVFASSGIDGHVLIVDDGSPDGTAELAEAVGARDPRVRVLRRARKQGIGPAYRAGFVVALEAGADLIIEMDCDFSHEPQALPQLIAAAENADLVLGSRYVPGGAVTRWGAIRRAISRGGCWYARTVLRVPIRDLTGGFKCFRRAVIEAIPLDQVTAAGYGFQVEMTYRAILLGFRVVEVPITFREREHGTSKMSRRIVLEAATLVPRLRRTLG
jgi:dolichol-phosphate mannosyltransferase